ncbi:MAG: hypothetical protein J6B87_02870 [Clostridia bacterium]|nr:hypothetical protein [Clostridia bacterium]
MGAYGSPELNNNSNNSGMVYCRKCGRMINFTVNKCPSCNYENIKPFYKKLSFYIILFLLYLLLISNSNTNVNYIEKDKILLSKDEFITTCEVYTYEELARNPQNYIGKNIKLTGEVIQVQELNKHVEMRVNIGNESYEYTDIIYCVYEYSENESRILENDNITLYGTCNGTKTYTTVLGSSLTIPLVKVEFIDINN